ncbi:CHAT domain-containing protein [Cyanobacteria bacterium FACHB-DQ100]|nr:CHAT domain-containing protein [Cyanobacteria bacterium FACHB-DQ100]
MPIRLNHPRWHLWVLFLGTLVLCLWFGTAANSQSRVDASQWVQQGVSQYRSGSYQKAIEAWQTASQALQGEQNTPELAIVQENLARAYHQLGDISQTLKSWDQTIALYQRLKQSGEVGRILVEKAQLYSQIGQPKQAIALVCQSDSSGLCKPGSALQLARASQNQAVEAAALGSLAEAYRLTGNHEAAIATAESGLKIAQALGLKDYQAIALLSLGNSYSNLAQINYHRAESSSQRDDQIEAKRYQQIGKESDQQAITYLKRSLEILNPQNQPLVRQQVLQGLIPIYYRIGDPKSAQSTHQQAITVLQQLPENRDRVYASITLAHLLEPVQPTESFVKPRCLSKASILAEERLLNQAQQVASRIRNPRAESFALGEWGHLAECQGDFATATRLTQQARWAAEQEKDSLYLWEWQAARLLTAQNQRKSAIAMYDRTIKTLESIRGDILTSDRELQLDFRDTVEPIYRERIALGLQADKSSSKATASELGDVLKTMDSLKLAELQNYFGNDCVIKIANISEKSAIDTSTTAVFSSIILEGRTAIILSLPNQAHQIAWIDTDNRTLRATVNEFRRGLERFYDDYDSRPAQQLYDWVIRPFASSIANSKVTTLVFVQDGILRSVPMAALHDGQQFLIQKYAVVTTPSLAFTEASAPSTRPLRALILGLTQGATIAGRTFQPLPYVTQEIQNVERLIPESKPLLDQSFTRARLQKELTQESYPILHIATHGEFSSDPENSFLITGDRQKLTLNQLDVLIRSTVRQNDPLELLTLTACQSAAGDERAALGLAGIAIQAGAKSALASLWFINDAATAKLSSQFYQGLRSHLSKTEALRAAQRSLLESDSQYSHPAYWAAFVLVGNWN